MSYILDALRRAEAERLRGQVPGIGTAVASPDGALSESRSAWVTGRQRLRWLVLAAAAGLAVALVAAAVAMWVMTPARQASGVPVSTVPPAGLDPGAATVAAPPQPAGSAAAASAGSELAAPLPALPVVVSAPPIAAAPASRSGEAAPPVMTPEPSAAPSRALKLGELSAEQRRDLPALVVGGSVWSESASSRFLILNGQMLREGESLPGGLQLQRLQPKSALLRWRGLLIELAL